MKKRCCDTTKNQFQKLKRTPKNEEKLLRPHIPQHAFDPPAATDHSSVSLCLLFSLAFNPLNNELVLLFMFLSERKLRLREAK